MTKRLLGLTLLVAMVVSAQLCLSRVLKQSPGMMAQAAPYQIPSPTTTPAVKACPSACSAQLTATDAKVRELQAQVDQLREAMNHDIPILNERTLDLNDRLKKLEGRANWDRAQAELNQLDARVAQLERPEVEDDAK